MAADQAEAAPSDGAGGREVAAGSGNPIEGLYSPPNEAAEDIGIEDADKAGAGSGDGLGAEVDPEGVGSDGVSFATGGMIAVADPCD